VAKHKYTLASETGAERYGGEVGQVVELDLTANEKQAVIAAGWVEPHDTEASKDDAAATKGGKK
jgi:hypothetical protein